ncbi:hypothetical protein BH11PSE12_BH11PSE12_01730 [soil metagenome]
MNEKHLTLADQQRLFADALLDLDRVTQVLPLFKEQTGESLSYQLSYQLSEQLSDQISEQPTGNLTQAKKNGNRFAFYRGNLSAIWVQALSGAYPVLLQLVGADFFAQMARAYGQYCPSQSGDLHHFGAGLAAFLAQAPMVADYPYFTDVATLEWQVHTAYYAADAGVLTLPGLLAQVAESAIDLQQVRLQVHPAARLHSSASASVAVWQSHQDAGAGQYPAHLAKSSYALITRKDWQVSVLPVEPAAYLGLQGLFQGQSLAAALEAAVAYVVDAKVDTNPQFDITAQLQSWFSAGAFSGYENVHSEDNPM